MRYYLPMLCAMLALASGCRLFESDREKLVRSMLEHPERIDSIVSNNPLSHEYAMTSPITPGGERLLERYFRRVRDDYRIEEVETSKAPETTLVRVVSRKRGVERAQFQFLHDSAGWQMETLVIGHPQFTDDW